MSLREGLTAAASTWASTPAGRHTPLVFNFAGTNVLAHQLRAAPVADVFVSADESWMAALVDQGLAERATVRTLFGNELVVVARRDRPASLRVPVHDGADLAQLPFRYLAIGQPEVVPAGRYAREWLQHERSSTAVSLWEALAKRLAPAADVRAALALVRSQPDVFGVVYRSDLAAAPEVEVILAVPPTSHTPIRYQAARLVAARHPEAAARFLSFLAGEQAQAAFTRLGFTPASEP